MLREEIGNRNDSERGCGELDVERYEYTHELWQHKPRQADRNDECENDDDTRVHHSHFYFLLHGMIFFILSRKVIKIFRQVSGFLADTYESDGIRRKVSSSIHCAPESVSIIDICADFFDKFSHRTFLCFTLQCRKSIGHVESCPKHHGKVLNERTAEFSKPHVRHRQAHSLERA